jgi:hypothetical protein
MYNKLTFFFSLISNLILQYQFTELGSLLMEKLSDVLLISVSWDEYQPISA